MGPRWGGASYHLPCPSRSVSWVCSGSAISGVLCVSSVELISGVTLLGDVNHPGSKEDLVSNWEPACSLVEDAISGAEFAPAHSGMCFPGLHCSGSRLLCRGTVQSRPAFHALSRSKLLRLSFSCTPQGHRFSWACDLCPSQIRTAQVTRCLVSTVAPN